MSAAYISTIDFHSQQYIEFSINAARDDNNKDLAAIYNTFIPLHDLSYGKVFKQSDNGELWHVNPGNTIARKITEERFRFFLEWDTRSLLPNDHLFDKLKSIGGLPAGMNSLSPDYINFPCKVTMADCVTIDLCLIQFSAAPPYQTDCKKLLFLDDIIDVEPSELALDHHYRMQSMLAVEIRMSFYPFLLRTKTGDLLLYNGTTHFVSTGEIKGNDIECQVPFSYDSKFRFMEVPNNDITYVIGKWDHRFDELFSEYRNMLNNWQNG